MKPIIQVEDLSKLYTVGSQATLSLRDLAEELWNKMRLKSKNPKPGEYQFDVSQKGPRPNTFWALKDVSFSVNRGDVVGVIGRNGAGKSTLLKILSKITEPTTGKAILRGRVASLLEVGTGFHPDLSGRENIYLNGTILGMKRWEINRKFKEIVEFAEVEKFIDTPVKHYSSGMYVRLAFAVAAHLESEILLVDEVLAVGDAGFQKKCLGEIGNITQQGRTVILVSHQMASIKSLCKRVIMMKQGRMECDGSPDEAIAAYLTPDQMDSKDASSWTHKRGSGAFIFTKVEFLNAANQPIDAVMSGKELKVSIEYQTKKTIDPRNLILIISFWDIYGNVWSIFDSKEMGAQFSSLKEKGLIQLSIPQMLLRSGFYSLKLWASHGDTAEENIYDVIENAKVVNVIDGDFWNTRQKNRSGPCALMYGEIKNLS